MATLRFGKQEEVVCIADVNIQTKEKIPTCLAYKTSTHFFGAGLYVTNDGYVLGVRQSKRDYLPLDVSAIRTYQAAGELPSPLPTYSVPWSTYAIGYSLWLCILAAVLVEILRRVLAARKRAHIEQLRATHPVSAGPPPLRTKADSFIAAQVVPLLRPGEQVQHQAYGIDRDISERGFDSLSAMGLFVVLTSQRLILVRTRIGAFGVLLENRGMEAFERSAIVSVLERGDLLTFVLAGGAQRQLHIKFTRALSNQLSFLRDVPRLLTSQPPANPSQANTPFTSPAST